MIENSSVPVLPLTAIKCDEGFGAWNLASAPILDITGTYHEVIARPDIASAYNCKYAGKYYTLSFRPTFNVVINPSIADEITYKVRYNLVEFEGSEWDVQFKNIIILLLIILIRYTVLIYQVKDQGMILLPQLFKMKKKVQRLN